MRRNVSRASSGVCPEPLSLDDLTNVEFERAWTPVGSIIGAMPATWGRPTSETRRDSNQFAADPQAAQGLARWATSA